MTRYTEEVEKVFKTIQPPVPGFIVDLIEYPGTISLRVYQPNVMRFKTEEKVQLATYLYELRDAIRMLGVNCEIEGVENEPPHNAVVKKAKEKVKRVRDGGSNGL